MSISTYAELQSALADWLMRSDLTSVIPSFITLAEARFDRELRHWEMEKRCFTTASDRYVTLPDGFLAAKRIKLDGKSEYLKQATSSKLQEMQHSYAFASGEPEWFAMTAGEIELFPTPDESYTLEMVYYTSVPRLSDTRTTNWLLERGPDAYLYGSLLHSAPYIKDDQRLPVWDALYKTAVQGLNIESEQGTHGQRLRMR